MNVTSFVVNAAMAISQSSVKQQVNVSLMKAGISSAENSSAELLKTMEQSVRPNLGNKIDVRG